MIHGAVSGVAESMLRCWGGDTAGPVLRVTLGELDCGGDGIWCQAVSGSRKSLCDDLESVTLSPSRGVDLNGRGGKVLRASRLGRGSRRALCGFVVHVHACVVVS